MVDGVRLKLTALLTLCVLMSVLVGCEGGPPARAVKRPESPFARLGIEKMAVVMLNATEDVSVDELEFARIFSTELQQFSGIKVFPAAVVEAAVRNNRLIMPQQANELGRLLKVDALIVGFITEYDAYDTPSVGLLVLMYEMTETTETTGVPTEGQPDKKSAESKPLVTVQRVYDSEQRSVMKQVEAFAASRNAGKGPLGAKRYTMVMSNYLHFVSDRIIRDLFRKVN